MPEKQIIRGTKTDAVVEAQIWTAPVIEARPKRSRPVTDKPERTSVTKRNGAKNGSRRRA